MPSNAYWEHRQVVDAYEVFQDAEAVANELRNVYWRASRYITDRAKDIFERFRDKYGLTDKAAWQLINTMRDSASVDELLQKLAGVKQTESIKELRKQLESQSYRARLERLKDLNTQIDNVMRSVYRQELSRDTDFLKELASGSYYKGIFRLHQRVNAAFSFAHVDHKVIDHVLNMNWSGTHYSKRIWNNTQKLAQTLKEELIVNLITGRSEREAAEIINEKFAGGASAARRLIRTESNHVSTSMNFSAYEEAGIEEYMYLATLDLKTSKICRSLDGNIYKVSERKEGTNCPPMHPWCRSTTIAVVDREFLQNATRSANDPATGKTIKVPLTMKYHEWHEKYVKGKQEAEAKEKALRNKAVDKKQYEKYRRIFDKDIPDSLVKFQEMKYTDPKKWNELKNRKQETINAMDIETVKRLNGMLGNKETRLWYKIHDESIPGIIDTSRSLHEQAKQAHELRNAYRTQARDLMSDQEKRKQLDIDYPNRSFEELMNRKQQVYRLTGEAAYKDILRSSTTTNREYDRKAGLDK